MGRSRAGFELLKKTGVEEKKRGQATFLMASWVALASSASIPTPDGGVRTPFAARGGRRAGGRTEKVDEALAGLRHRVESGTGVDRHHHGIANRED